MGAEQAAGTMQIVSRRRRRAKASRSTRRSSPRSRRKIVAIFERQADAFYTSGLLLDDGVIDPRDTRRVLAQSPRRLRRGGSGARCARCSSASRGRDALRRPRRRQPCRFTHEHDEIQRTLKRFIDEEINPHVDEWEAAEIFPAHEVFKRLGELGLLGLTKPEEYGGAGARLLVLDGDGRGARPHRLRRRADGDRRADRHGDAGAGALRQRRAAPRVPGAGDRRRHGRLHRRLASPAPARDVAAHQDHGAARTAATTSSTAPRCGSPTACRPTGCACWSTPSKARRTRTRA